MAVHQQHVITGEPGQGGRAGLRVNVFSEFGVIGIRDTAIQIGLTRDEAAALAVALRKAVRALDRAS